MFLKSSQNTAPVTPAPAGKTPQPIQPAKKPVPSVISMDVNVLGNIVSEGAVDFDGGIDGNIRCGTLLLRHHGRVNGEIHADAVQIYGRVKGLIKARSVHLHAGCNVEGVVMHETLIIEDGANIDGKIKRTNKPVASSAGTALSAVGATSPLLPEAEFGVLHEEADTATSSTESSDAAADSAASSKVLENLRLIAG